MSSEGVMRGNTQGTRGLPKWWREPDFVAKWWRLQLEHKGAAKRIAADLGISIGRYYMVNQWVPLPGEEPRLLPDEKREYNREAKRRELGLEPLAVRSSGRPRYKRGIWLRGKRLLTAAAQEARSQRERSAEELLERGGRPFWDEAGKAEANRRDREAVDRLFGRRAKED